MAAVKTFFLFLLSLIHLIPKSKIHKMETFVISMLAKFIAGMSDKTKVKGILKEVIAWAQFVTANTANILAGTAEFPVLKNVPEWVTWVIGLAQMEIKNLKGEAEVNALVAPILDKVTADLTQLEEDELADEAKTTNTASADPAAKAAPITIDSAPVSQPHADLLTTIRKMAVAATNIKKTPGAATNATAIEKWAGDALGFVTDLVNDLRK